MNNVNTKLIKGRMPVYVALLILVLSGMWMLGRCSHPQNGSVAARFTHPGGDTLAVAIEMSPLTYAYSGDTVVGFDYELIRQMCAAHGQPVVFQPFAPLEYALKGLEDHTFDLVVANLPATSAIRKNYGTTEAVFTDRAVLVQRADTADSSAMITNTRQLAGREVWIADGSTLRSRLEHLAAESGEDIIIKSNPEYSAELLGIMVQQGKIPCAVINETVARQLKSDYPDIDISLPISFSQFQTWIVRRGDDSLLNKLNSWIKQYKATPAYRHLVNKYMQ
ncbi:MAG: transporter substrate-binding domain-containing protein [Muribaculaceae bacterium]|nr:transporter substrate-binding domain-containing protein [Muribaculaceae bacterium]